MRSAVLCGVLLVVACGPATNPLITEAQDAVKRQLRDPESAQFREVRACDKPGGVQGEVNGRTIAGGYAGFTSFIYVRGEIATLSLNGEIGEELRFDPQRYDRLRRLCWSDESIRTVDREMRNSGASADPVPPPDQATNVARPAARRAVEENPGEGEPAYPPEMMLPNAVAPVENSQRAR